MATTSLMIPFENVLKIVSFALWMSLVYELTEDCQYHKYKAMCISFFLTEK